MLLSELIAKLEKEEKESLNFSEGLWETGDKVNAHFQEGRAKGIRFTIDLLLLNQKEHLEYVKKEFKLMHSSNKLSRKGDEHE